MKDGKICVGVVGAGWAGNVHAQAYNHVYGVGVDLKVVCALEPTIPEFAAKYNFRSYTDDFNKVINDDEIDVVDIITPPFLHKSMIISALRAGKHVICEKPLTGYFGARGAQNVGDTSRAVMLTQVRQDLEEIEAVLKETRKKFFYSENWIYSPAFRRACELIRMKGTTVLEMRSLIGHKGSQAAYVKYWSKSGGGTGLRNITHPLSTALYLKRLEMEAKGKTFGIKSIYCDCAQVTRDVDKGYVLADPDDTEDWSHAVITFTDGTKATITAGDIYIGGAVNEFEIYGSDASYKCNFSQSTLLEAYFSDSKGLEDTEVLEKSDGNIGYQRADVSAEFIRGYDAEIQDFMECIKYDREPICDFDIAKVSSELVYLGYLSAEQNRRIDL